MNHLLIGLGGTGGRILKAYRKLMYQQFREGSPDGVCIDYLFIDSDPKSFRDDDPTWSVLGKSVQLPKRSQLLISEANLLSVIQDLNSHPNLKPWLGDKAAWGELLASLNVDAAGGQKRRLGRFLFAMNVRKFREAITTLVRDLQDEGKSSAVTFHIFCGLAGGTGSGAIIDTIAQLRAQFPDRAQRIMVYAYLPDLNPPANWNTGNYHANAYAALLELNAMSAGAWSPFNVYDGSGPVKADFWYNGCYVFSDENQQGFRASIENDLADIVADFVFHKSVVARKVAWDDLSRFENSENGDASPEAVGGTGQGQRSVRFLSFGIRRLAFPEETIREYLTYHFAVQAMHQLQYNNWQDTQGFVEQARPQANAEFVADAKSREDWRVTDEHLQLSRPIIDTEGSRRWKPYEKEWEEYETHYLMLAKQTDKIKWLNELKALFNAAWNESFRGSGVKAFFQTAERDLRNMAVAIRDRVEASLFDDWRNGTRSLNECGRIIAALIEDLSARLLTVDNFVAKREESYDHLARQFQAIEAEWSNFKVLGALTNSRERDLTKAAMLLREESIALTLAEAGRTSKKLIAEVRDQLSELKSCVDLGESALATAAEQAAKVVSARSPKPEETDLAHASSYVVHIEDGKAIELARRKLVLSEEEQRVQTAAVRADIIARLGQQASFRVFTRRMADAEIRNAIIAKCEQNVDSAHQRLISERQDKVIGVSVIDKLMDRWGIDNDRLSREVTELARSAGHFLVFDPTEQNKHYEGRSSVVRSTEAFAVILPEPPEQKEFVEKLKTAFKDARTGKVSFVASDERSNEITVVSLVNLFPLRFVRNVKALRERYDQRMAQIGRERGTLEVHTEGDGSQFPDLFIPVGGADWAPKVRRVMLLAQALSIVTESRDPQSGQQRIVLARKDADGFDMEPLVLGKTLASAVDDATEKTVYELKQAVVTRARQLPLLDEAEQARIRNAMIAVIDALKAATGKGADDPEIMVWNTAAREAMRFVRKEAEL